jgi:hypothetical protein
MEIAGRKSRYRRWAPVAAALVLSSLTERARAESPASHEPVPQAWAAPPPQALAEPPVGLSIGLGLGVALAPMAIGGGMAALSGAGATRRRSLEILAGGLALAPVVSHMVAGEWSRAAAFGGVTFTAALLATALLESVDVILDDTKHPACILLGGTLAGLLVASGVGLADSLMAGERVSKASTLQLRPSVGKGTLALSLRGRL